MAAAPFLQVLLPALLLALGGLVCLALEPFSAPRAKHRLLPWIAVVALLGAGLVQLLLLPAGGETVQLGSLLALDAARGWLCLGIAASAIAGIAGLQQSAIRDERAAGEPYALMLLAALGAQGMVLATHWIGLFVSLELASIAIYALVGSHRERRESGEALLKYLVMGACFSAVLLYGIAMHYGATGSLQIGAPVLAGREPLLLLGLGLVLVGLLFKVGAVPFHFWSPDAYAGAPMAVTGFMAGAVKIGGFAALGGIWLHLLDGQAGTDLARAISIDTAGFRPGARLPLAGMLQVITGAAVLSLLVGSFAALGQTRLRRLMAYSSIAHAGYMLLALCLPTPDAFEAHGSLDLRGLWVYLLGYGIAGPALLGLLAGACGPGDEDELSRLSGYGRRHPIAGVMATLLLVSLAGLPPSIGFVGKYLVLGDLVAKGHVGLALGAVALAVVGVVYYGRVIVLLWSGGGEAVAQRRPLGLAYGIAAAASVAVLVLLVRPPLVAAPSAAPADAAADGAAATPDPLAGPLPTSAAP